MINIFSSFFSKRYFCKIDITKIEQPFLLGVGGNGLRTCYTNEFTYCFRGSLSRRTTSPLDQSYNSMPQDKQ